MLVTPYMCNILYLAQKLPNLKLTNLAYLFLVFLVIILVMLTLVIVSIKFSLLLLKNGLTTTT